MSKKVPTLTLKYNDRLAYGKNTTPFKVVKITDSVQFLPGDNLGADRVAHLCRNPNFKVVITGKDA